MKRDELTFVSIESLTGGDEAGVLLAGNPASPDLHAQITLATFRCEGEVFIAEYYRSGGEWVRDHETGITLGFDALDRLAEIVRAIRGRAGGDAELDAALRAKLDEIKGRG